MTELPLTLYAQRTKYERMAARKGIAAMQKRVAWLYEPHRRAEFGAIFKRLAGLTRE